MAVAEAARHDELREPRVRRSGRLLCRDGLALVRAAREVGNHGTLAGETGGEHPNAQPTVVHAKGKVRIGQCDADPLTALVAALHRLVTALDRANLPAPAVAQPVCKAALVRLSLARARGHVPTHAVRLVSLPLAGVLVIQPTGRGVLAVTIVHPVPPPALVHVAVGIDHAALARAPVVSPLADVRASAVVANLAMAVAQPPRQLRPPGLLRVCRLDGCPLVGKAAEPCPNSAEVARSREDPHSLRLQVGVRRRELGRLLLRVRRRRGGRAGRGGRPPRAREGASGPLIDERQHRRRRLLDDAVAASARRRPKLRGARAPGPCLGAAAAACRWRAALCLAGARSAPPLVGEGCRFGRRARCPAFFVACREAEERFAASERAAAPAVKSRVRDATHVRLMRALVKRSQPARVQRLLRAWPSVWRACKHVPQQLLGLDRYIIPGGVGKRAVA